jgi:periplasmic copper chaperone A
MYRFLAAAAVAAWLASVAPALAHVELETDQAPAGSSYKAVLMVPHGCAGSATTGIRVQLPDGVIGAKPMPKPGWRIAVKSVRLLQPIEIEGVKLTDSAKEIDWTGGNLPDTFYDEFVFVATLPDKPGEILYFPVVQECAQGQTRWIEIPAQGENAEELKAPAPSLRLGPKKAGGD